MYVFTYPGSNVNPRISTYVPFLCRAMASINSKSKFGAMASLVRRKATNVLAKGTEKYSLAIQLGVGSR